MGLAGFAVTAVLTATAVVPVSYAVQNTRAIGAADLKPSDCAALTLSSIVKGTGSISSVGNGNGELVLASAANDTITVKGGNECVVGGAGTDSVNVLNGTAVCVISTTSSQSGCTTVVRRP
jgi:hypothetical protein